MSLDKSVLEGQKAAFIANGEEINRGISTRVQQIQDFNRQIEELNRQIEQHRGASAYNQILVTSVDAQLNAIVQAEKAAEEAAAKAAAQEEATKAGVTVNPPQA